MRKAALKPDRPPFTEQDIRRLALGYLRSHYRFTSRRDFGDQQHQWSEHWSSQAVDKPHVFRNGITVDAHLTIFQADGSPFVATIEATDLKRRHEVDYRFNWVAALQDSLAAGLVGASFLLVLPQVWGSSFGQDLLTTSGRVALGLNLLLAMAIYLLVAHRRVAYRYIYAVNQFRCFHADAQWIAFDAALYTEPRDRRFLELQRQCIRFGFGLIAVEADRSIRLHLSPSRNDQFGGARRVLPDWTGRIAPLRMAERLEEAGRRVRDALPAPHLPSARLHPHEEPAHPPSAEDARPLAERLAELNRSSDSDASIQSLPPDAQDPSATSPVGVGADPLTTDGSTRESLQPPPAAGQSGWFLANRWRQLRQWYRDNRVVDPDLPRFYRPRTWSWIAVVLAIVAISAVYLMEYRSRRTVEEGDALAVPNIEGLDARIPEGAAPYYRPGSDDLPEEVVEDLPPVEPMLDQEPLQDLIEDPATLGGTDLYSLRLYVNGESRSDFECTPRYLIVSQETFYLVAGQFDDWNEGLRVARDLRDRMQMDMTLLRTSCLTRFADVNFTLYAGHPTELDETANFLVRSYRRKFGGDWSILSVGAGG